MGPEIHGAKGFVHLNGKKDGDGEACLNVAYKQQTEEVF